MSPTPRRRIDQVTPDPSQLKALAHPVRLKMLEMLRLDGPATSTTVAARLGMNTGTVSYHLRQLARHGFIEDDLGVGTRRDRWWRASHESTSIPSPGAATASEDDVRARQAYNHAVVLTQVARLQESLLERAELPRRWAAVTDDSDWTLWLTPRQARELMDKVHDVLRSAAEAAPREKGAAAKGSAQYSINLHGFPRPGRLVPGARTDPEAF
jgi:DNA-binding transcriptional ArsR family regulator